METCLGKVGIVNLIRPSGDVMMSVCGHIWSFNPVCLVPAPGKPIDGGGGGSEVTGMSKR